MIVAGESENEILVRTYMRDPGSYRARRYADETMSVYPYEVNTAFRKILSAYMPDFYFLSNDLDEYDGYDNANQNRRKFYNAVLVAPIRIKQVDGVYRNLGFLCVDNQEGGFLDGRDVDLVLSFADSIFVLFSMLDEIKALVVPRGDV